MEITEADVLDQLALYPHIRENGLARRDIVDAIGIDPDDDTLTHRLTGLLGSMAQRGLISKTGTSRDVRWFITPHGMDYQPNEDWTGNQWPGPTLDDSDHWDSPNED